MIEATKIFTTIFFYGSIVFSTILVSSFLGLLFLKIAKVLGEMTMVKLFLFSYVVFTMIGLFLLNVKTDPNNLEGNTVNAEELTNR